jgi:hypothetical protein
VLQLIAARLTPADAASLALACRAGSEAAAAVAARLAVPAAALFGGGTDGGDEVAAVAPGAAAPSPFCQQQPQAAAAAASALLLHNHHHHHHQLIGCRKRVGPLPAPEPLSGGGARRRLAAGRRGAPQQQPPLRPLVVSPSSYRSAQRRQQHFLLKYYSLERLVVRGCGDALCPLTAAHGAGAAKGCCGGDAAGANANGISSSGGLAAALAAAGRLQSARHAAGSPLFAAAWPPAPPAPAPAGVLVLGTGKSSGGRAVDGHATSLHRGALASSCDNSSSDEEGEDDGDLEMAQAGTSSRGGGSGSGSGSSSVCAMSVDGAGSSSGARSSNGSGSEAEEGEVAACQEEEEDEDDDSSEDHPLLSASSSPPSPPPPLPSLPLSFLPTLKALRALDLGTSACAAAVRRLSFCSSLAAGGNSDIIRAIGSARLPHLQRLVLPAALWAQSPSPALAFAPVSPPPPSSPPLQLSPLALLPALESVAFVGAPASPDLARLLGQLGGCLTLRALAFDASAFAPIAAPSAAAPATAVLAAAAAACAASAPPQDETFLGRCLAHLPASLESLAVANLRTVNGAVFAALTQAKQQQQQQPQPQPPAAIIGLRHLELAGCAALAPRALGALAASPWGPGLERLRLGGCVEMASPTRAALPARELGRMARLEELVMLAAAAAAPAGPAPAPATATTPTTCPCGCGEGGDGLPGVELHVHDLPALSALPVLKRLRVGGLHACVTASAVVSAARAAPLGAPLARLEALAVDDVCALSESLWYPHQQQVQQQVQQQQAQQQQQQPAPAPATANTNTNANNANLPVGVLAALCPALRSLSVRRAEGVAVALRASARHPALETLLLGGGGRADGWCGGRLFAGEGSEGEAASPTAPAADATWAYDDGRTWWGEAAFTAGGVLRGPVSAAAAVAGPSAASPSPAFAPAQPQPLLQPAVWAWLITLPKLDTVVVHSSDHLVAPMPPAQPLFGAAAPVGLLAPHAPPPPSSREPLMLFTALGRARRVALLSWHGADDASLWSASRLLRGCSELVVAGAAGLTDAGLALLGETAAQPPAPPQDAAAVAAASATTAPTPSTATRRLRLLRCPGVTDAGVRALVAVARTLAASSSSSAGADASAPPCGCHHRPTQAPLPATTASRRRPSLLLDLIECGPLGPLPASPSPPSPPLLLSPLTNHGGGGGAQVLRRASI